MTTRLLASPFLYGSMLLMGAPQFSYSQPLVKPGPTKPNPTIPNPVKANLELVNISSQDPRDGVFDFAEELQGNLTYSWIDNENQLLKIASLSLAKAESKFVTISLKEVKTPTINWLLDVKQSPDGSMYAFKYGAVQGGVSRYALLVVDTRTGKMHLVSPLLSYRDFFWSPDSRYLSYIENGTLEGKVDRDQKPVKLCVYDTRKFVSQTVLTSNFVANSFCWAAPHQLYYGVPESSTSKPTSGRSNQSSSKSKDQSGQKNAPILASARPNLYHYSIETKKATMLFRDCYRPTISDDGKRVAFFGEDSPARLSPLPARWLDKANGMTLCVSDLDGKNRKPMRKEQGDYPVVHWGANGKSVIAFKQMTPGPVAELDVAKWNTQTGKSEQKLTVKITDPVALPYREEINRPDLNFRFVFLGRYRQQDKLLFNSRRFVKPASGNVLATDSVVTLVDLEKGTSRQVAVATQGGAVTPMRWNSSSQAPSHIH